MKIKVNKTIEDNKNKVFIYVYDLTKADMILFANFGEPIIDIGGTIGATTMTSELKKIYSDAPHIYINDVSTVAADNELISDTWITTIIDRMEIIMGVYRDKIITWETEFIQTI